MPRDVPPSFISLLAEKEIYPFFAIDINFNGTYTDPLTGQPVTATPLYLWSGYGDLIRTETGKTYLGAGQFLNVSSVGETSEIEAKGANLSLSGIPSSFLSLALNTPYQGKECKIYLGLLSQPNYLMTQDNDFILTQGSDFLMTEAGTQGFIEVFSGELDQMNISEGADSSTINITVENILIKLDRPVTRRFSSEDQKSRYPTDKGLEFVVSLQDKEIFWGKASP